MKRAIVQVPAFEEGPRLEATLQQIAEQEWPPTFDTTIEAWVTRSEDEHGVCSTWQAAERVPRVDVHEAPEGKLSARNAAHEDAVNRDADLIVQWDADAKPLGEGVLASLLTTAASPGVAVANSKPLASPAGPLGTLVDAAGAVEDRVRPHVHGQAHAFSADLWRSVGPFSEAVDQTDIKAVRREEEFRFYDAAAERGDVVTAPGAEVFNDPRRHEQRLGLGEPESLAERGARSFNLRDR